MSLVTSFLLKHLVPALEAAFVAHEPEMQAALLSEVETFSSDLLSWYKSKIAPVDLPDPITPAS